MSDDAMVVIANLVSRSEALTVAALLDSAGIVVHVGGEHYAGTTLNILAIGGFRLTVPAAQWAEASDLLRDVAMVPPAFSRAVQRRALILLAIVFTLITLPGALVFSEEEEDLFGTAVAFVLPLCGTPVAPQGRGDYFLLPATA